MADMSALVRRLVEAGASPGIAAEVVAEVFIAGVQSAPHRVDEAAERRREKDRERKRTLCGNLRNSAESAEEGEQKKVPPITPLKKTQPPEAYASDPQRSKPKKGTRLPDDWQPLESLLLFGSELGFSRVTTGGELAKFKDHFLAASGSRGVKNNWDSAARNWLRRAVDMRGPKPQYYQLGGGKDAKSGSVVDAADRLIERIRDFDKPLTDEPRTGGGEGATVIRMLPPGGRERS